MKRLVVGITGASGVIYGVRLLEILNQLNAHEIHLTISDSGMRALWEELQIRVDLDNFKVESLLGGPSDQIVYHHQSDIAAPIASGSFRTDGMIVAPCSMGTVGSIAAGISRNLIHRAADVCIKERRKVSSSPPRNPPEFNPPRKYAQALSAWYLYSPCHARLLSLPGNCGRSN